ncbi:MAG: protein phosphatase 2C domain-containing protein [Spirulina sp. SIO3F2]|nr:protein phosphatase 2C domain-containing protein [Spirulina sp. SIO3F2]
MQPFQWSAATIKGRGHRRLDRNNQDAVSVSCTEEHLIALVCDGCGSGAHSEVGAKLGIKLLQRILVTNLGLYPQPQFWQTVRSQLLSQLKQLILSLDENVSQTISDYFLFTIVGTILTPEEATVFAIGDGVVAVNGAVKVWDYPDNAPPYIVYGLMDSHSSEWDWQFFHQGHTAEIQSLLIGTDGVQDLIKSCDRLLPGKSEPVGELSQFWTEDRYFKNPDQLRRRLSLINRDVHYPSLQPGLLNDDTSLVVIRRL